jgi:hypothetical protein
MHELMHACSRQCRELLMCAQIEKLSRGRCNSHATWIQWHFCFVNTISSSHKLLWCCHIFIQCYVESNSCFRRDLTSKFCKLNGWLLDFRSLPESSGDDLLVEIQDSKGVTHGRLVVHIATISDDPVLSLSLSLHLRLSVYLYRYRYRNICIIEIWFHSSPYIICGWPRWLFCNWNLFPNVVQITADVL